METNVIEIIRYLNSEDGPNIPLRTIAAYVGSDQPSLSRYLNGVCHPREDRERQLEQGVREMVMEICDECKGLFDRRVL